jgi:ADP-L-glycero-D-manno-heptose 6-epimerase
MYVVTGGAGFIGSNVVAALAARGEEVVVCDWLRDERWRNLAKHEIAEIIDPGQLLEWLGRNRNLLDAVIHMGAVSSTDETDVGLIVENNVRATLSLFQWCTQSGVRLIYASSAATYGDGACGFDDVFTCEALARLRPLNPYGWSKHLVDRRVARLVEGAQPVPPQWAGLKLFNVYGPNEYHKGSMQSLMAKSYTAVRSGEPLRLFRSRRPDYADGAQMRDFVYVRDCVDVMLWLLDNPRVSGLFNVGTGRARSWLDLARALFDAMNRPGEVEFVELPSRLAHHYQYCTEARMSRLRAAGYDREFTSLEDGVRRYVHHYLATDDPFH